MKTLRLFTLAFTFVAFTHLSHAADSKKSTAKTDKKPAAATPAASTPLPDPVAVVDGTDIKKAELEKEAGGSGLRYSFDITSNHQPFEVGIDARTGAILENKAEGKNPD